MLTNIVALLSSVLTTNVAELPAQAVDTTVRIEEVHVIQELAVRDGNKTNVVKRELMLSQGWTIWSGGKQIPFTNTRGTNLLPGVTVPWKPVPMLKWPDDLTFGKPIPLLCPQPGSFPLL